MMFVCQSQAQHNLGERLSGVTTVSTQSQRETFWRHPQQEPSLTPGKNDQHRQQAHLHFPPRYPVLRALPTWAQAHSCRLRLGQVAAERPIHSPIPLGCHGSHLLISKINSTVINVIIYSTNDQNHCFCRPWSNKMQSQGDLFPPEGECKLRVSYRGTALGWGEGWPDGGAWELGYPSVKTPP